MITISQARGLSERLEKACVMALAGDPKPVAGLDGYYVVRGSDGSRYYLVDLTPGHERCTCPDWQTRGRALNLPCKHLLAAQLVAETATPTEA